MRYKYFVLVLLLAGCGNPRIHVAEESRGMRSLSEHSVKFADEQTRETWLCLERKQAMAIARVGISREEWR